MPGSMTALPIFQLPLLHRYRALFTNRFGALGKAHFQNTIVEARFNLVLIHQNLGSHEGIHDRIHSVQLLGFNGSPSFPETRSCHSGETLLGGLSSTGPTGGG